MSVINYQELFYEEDFDYLDGSPHLKHKHLYRSLVNMLRDAIDHHWHLTNTPHLLEIGAGEGYFVEPALAAGCQVTVTEMSRHSIDTLTERYGHNTNFRAFYDPDGSLTQLQGERFDVVLYASVLHHIPDYLSAIDSATTRHLKPGGRLLTFQDPLWYPTRSRATAILSRAAYVSWRIGQGNIGRGLRTTLRRLRHDFDENNPSDMVEYHVVRNGVNEHQLIRFLERHFEDVTINSYWSTQSPLWQRLGEKLGINSTFAVHARNYTDR
jgi:SAM-dependent methyltransferase